MTTSEKILKIVNSVQAQVTKGTTQEVRREMLIAALKAEGFNAVDAGEKSGGKAFRVSEMSSCYRIYYRCGYGFHNYAPCVEVNK